MSEGNERRSGWRFDLEAIYQALNRDYFDNRVQARITWGRRPPRRPRRSIRFGVYDARERLIRIHPLLHWTEVNVWEYIHPLLDQPFVPRYVVENVVFHEMLHQLHPPQRRNGRWLIHTPTFRRAERRFPYFEQAEAWQRRYVGRLLRG